MQKALTYVVLSLVWLIVGCGKSTPTGNSTAPPAATPAPVTPTVVIPPPERTTAPAVAREVVDWLPTTHENLISLLENRVDVTSPGDQYQADYEAVLDSRNQVPWVDLAQNLKEHRFFTSGIAGGINLSRNHYLTLRAIVLRKRLSNQGPIAEDQTTLNYLRNLYNRDKNDGSVQGIEYYEGLVTLGFIDERIFRAQLNAWHSLGDANRRPNVSYYAPVLELALYRSQLEACYFDSNCRLQDVSLPRNLARIFTTRQSVTGTDRGDRPELIGMNACFILKEISVLHSRLRNRGQI